jgi:hypothetical protein
MELFVYSDESGVFDQKNEVIFDFGGVVFFSKKERDNAERKFISVESGIKKRNNYPKTLEYKASKASNADKMSLFRSMNGLIKFGVVIEEKKIMSNIFDQKKSKQRYLDYAFKIGIKRLFAKLIEDKMLDPQQIERIYFFADEHTTATNGRYELREALLNEFKYGTYNETWDKFYPAIFPNIKDVLLDYCDSASIPLIRSADIIANHIYHSAISHIETSEPSRNLFVSTLP